MAQTPNLTKAAPPRGQMDRPYDPEERARMDREAPRLAMGDGHNALAGSAAGVGSVGYDDPGAFDVGSGKRVAPDDAEGVGPDGYRTGDFAELDRTRSDEPRPDRDGPPIEPLNRPMPPD